MTRVSCGHGELAAGEPLGIALRRDRFHPAETHEAAEGVTVEPVLPGLRAEVPVEELELALDVGGGERDVEVRPAEVAVDLRDLVLEDQVRPERVPRQLGREPVILVEVVAIGKREDLVVYQEALNRLKHRDR